MSDLIRREEAVKQIHETFGNQGWATVANVVEKILIGVPTIEERKEGHWISMFDEDESKCSECETEYYYPITRGYNYCPNCGAKMERSE